MLTLLLGLSLPFLCPNQGVDTVDVYVLTGQSNALGVMELESGAPGEDPLDAVAGFFWANVTAIGGPPRVFDDSGSEIARLTVQDGVGPIPAYWGPEYGFVREMARRGERDFIVVKVARTGGGNLFWSKGSEDDHMYRFVVESVHGAVAALAAKGDVRRPVVRALLYMQGESDRQPEAEVADERVLALAANLRRDLPGAEGLRLIISGIASDFGQAELVRAQQRSLAGREPAVTYFSNLDLRHLLTDRAHFGREGKLAVGQRFAEAVLAHGADGARPRSRVKIVRQRTVVRPLILGRERNPVLSVTVEVTAPVRLTGFDFDLRGTTTLADLKRVEVFLGDEACGVLTLADETINFAEERTLETGMHEFSVAVTLAEDADLDHELGLVCTAARFADGSVRVPLSARHVPAHRFGLALRSGGEEGVHTHRIPALATTNSGTLLAAYDLRYESSRDLPGHIDVGLSRSTDGGRTWEPMRRVLDMGPPDRDNGVGDPALLVDRDTGTVWIAALWSLGDRAWNGSGPGLTPEETGQWVLAKSEDDGQSWSEPISITAMVKRPEWRLFYAGPGKGLSTRDGTLVFPAQFRDGEGLPYATVVWSADHGATWTAGSGAKSNTTEAQVVELADGAWMLNMRDNRGGARSVAVTHDRGATWTEHETSRSALPEPVCMASLIAVPRAPAGADGEQAGEPDWLVFSNPRVPRGPRRELTVQLSFDQGLTWPAAQRLLLHEPDSAGYSCLTRIDAETLGILYEGGSTAQLVFQRIAMSSLSGPPQPVFEQKK